MGSLPGVSGLSRMVTGVSAGAPKAGQGEQRAFAQEHDVSLGLHPTWSARMGNSRWLTHRT